MLAGRRNGVYLLAGGTDLLLRAQLGSIRPRLLVDVKDLPGMSEVRFTAEEGLTIGAGATLSQIAGHSDIRRRYPLLAETCSWMGTPQIRMRATLGGHVCSAAPNADAATVLLCYDAVCQIQGAGVKRTVPLAAFYTAQGIALQQGEMLVALALPPPPPSSAGVYLTLRQGRGGRLTLAGAGVHVTGNQGDFEQWRIALAVAGPYPCRCPEIEASLAGPPPNAARIAQAAQMAGRLAQPPDDGRAGVAYRKAMIRVLVQRALSQVTEKLRPEFA